jgi:hypothetical protein
MKYRPNLPLGRPLKRCRTKSSKSAVPFLQATSLMKVLQYNAGMRSDSHTGNPSGAVSRATLILPSVALILSILSTILSILTFQENSSDQAIRSQYQMFLELTKMPGTQTEIAHLVALPSKYDDVSTLVSQTFKGASPREIAQAIIKERFIANYIFTLFEEALYQKDRAANQIFNSAKSRFNQEVLDYFTGRVLRNPRLLWYWSTDGGGLSEYYEASTRQYYTEHVLQVLDGSAPPKPDPVGPFGSR